MEFTNIKTFTLPETDIVFDSDFHPDKEAILAVGTIEGHVHIVRTDSTGSSLSKILTLKRHHKGSPIRKVCFSDEGLLFTAAKTVKVHDLDAGKTIRKIEIDSEHRIYSMCVIDRHMVAVGDDGGFFRLLDNRVNGSPVMEVKEFDDYISDLDVDFGRKLVLASSGEGTIAAFNIRSKRLEPPQSELFEAGFNCIRYLECRNKVVAGSDDGVLSIFNHKQWGNISDRFPIDSNESIEKIQVVDGSLLAVGCSSGKTLIVSILPNKIVKDLFLHKTPVESIAIQKLTSTIASLDSNVVKVAHFEPLVEAGGDSDSDSDREPETSKTKDEFFSDL